jgi:membrane protein
MSFYQKVSAKILTFIKAAYQIVYDTITGYTQDKVLRIGAALAYYTIFSLPALIIIVVGLVGFFYGEAAIQGQVYAQLQDFLGENVALQIENAVKSTGSSQQNWWATLLGICFLAFVATGIFQVIQEALNIIFGMEVTPRKISKSIILELINRLLSLTMILTLCSLFIVSIVLNTILLQITGFIRYNSEDLIANMPVNLTFLNPYIAHLTGYLLSFIQFAASIVLTSSFFALIYKILPAAKLSWSKAFLGALVAALLFWLGQILMGYYLATVGIISAYGAAGSLIVLLLWVYYSSQLLFIGAEFIKAYSKYKGEQLNPKPFAHYIEKN